MTQEKSQDRSRQERKDPHFNRRSPQKEPPIKKVPREEPLEKEKAPEKDPPPAEDRGKMHV